MNVPDQPHRSPDKPSAATDSPERRQEAIEVGTGKPERPKSRARNVLIVVVPIIAVYVVGLAFCRFMDMDRLWSDLTRPPLAAVTGQVLYHGEPLRNGQIMTQPIGGWGLSALGWTDDEGKFSLRTDIRGNYVDGATVGQHRVTVTAHESISRVGGPPLLTPQQYASMDSSPLQIKVGQNAKENEFQLVLEGDPPSQQGPGPAAGGMRKGGRGKAKAKEEAPSEP
jgi:hypothetical protein